MSKATGKASDPVINNLDNLKSIQETIVNATGEMNAVIEKMKVDIGQIQTTQTEHTGIIEENTGRIGALESVKNHHDNRILHVEERLERLERKQEFFQKIEDQDRKISQIMNSIQPIEMTKASCLVLLHGLPLPRNINTLDPRVPADMSLIKNSLCKGLSNKTTDFIFEITTEGNFKNISGWSKGPEICNHRYSDKIPKDSQNSLMFICTSRIQAMTLEAELRRSLITSSSARKETEYSSLELGIHADNPKIRALHKFLLFKGRLIVENLKVFDQYRVVFRGGSRRGGMSMVNLALELRASRMVIEGERKEYFMGKEGTSLIKNIWTDSRNVRISEPLATWFPPKNEYVERVERRLARPPVPPTEQNQNKEKTVKCDVPGCDKAFRSKQGMNNHKTKDHNKGVHIMSENEDSSTEGEPDEGGAAEEVVTVLDEGGEAAAGGEATTTVMLHQEGDNDGFTPVVSNKKGKKGKGRQGSQATATEKPTTRNSAKASTPLISFASALASSTTTPTTPTGTAASVSTLSSKQPKITKFGKSSKSHDNSLFPVPT